MSRCPAILKVGNRVCGAKTDGGNGVFCGRHVKCNITQPLDNAATPPRTIDDAPDPPRALGKVRIHTVYGGDRGRWRTQFTAHNHLRRTDLRCEERTARLLARTTGKDAYTGQPLPTGAKQGVIFDVEHISECQMMADAMARSPAYMKNFTAWQPDQRVQTPFIQRRLEPIRRHVQNCEANLTVATHSCNMLKEKAVEELLHALEAPVSDEAANALREAGLPVLLERRGFWSGDGRCASSNIVAQLIRVEPALVCALAECRLPAELERKDVASLREQLRDVGEELGRLFDDMHIRT